MSEESLPLELQMPQWSREEYMTTEPYSWLYDIYESGDQFNFIRLQNQMADRAKMLKVSNFVAMWRGYLKQVRDIKQAERTACNTTAFTDQPITLDCGAYICDDTGVYAVDKMGTEQLIISHPIMPVAIIHNIETEEERVRIAYRMRGQWKILTVGSEILANANKILALSSRGLAITTENARDVVRFLSEIKAKNEMEIPQISATNHLGWQRDGTFAPYGDGVEYDGDSSEYQRIFEGLTQSKGSRDVWMQVAHEVRTGASVPARIALATSFAAPLVSKLGGLPFIVHLWGASGCGKTVGLMLAASVWGNPPVGEYAKTFQATKVAIEGMAAFCANLPVIYDELQVMADRSSFDDIIYMLCEGASKGRGTKDGGLQVQKRWCTAILTSGEMSIVQENSGGGAALRTIDVNYGGRDLFEDGHKTSGILCENYGFVGREFIAAINEPGALKSLQEMRDKLYHAMADRIDGKQLLSASILLAADWFADQAIFHDGKSLRPSDILPYLVTRHEADKQRRCYEWLLGFIAANDLKFHNPENGECWGLVEGDVVYFIKTIFDAQLQKAGFQSSAFLSWAKRERKIKCEDYGDGPGKKRLTVRKVVNGVRVPCVAIVRDDKEDMEDENGFVRVDEPLPFMQ